MKIQTKEMAFPEGKTFTKDELADVYNANPNTYTVSVKGNEYENPFVITKYKATSLKALKNLLRLDFVKGTEVQIYKRVSIFKGNFII